MSKAQQAILISLMFFALTYASASGGIYTCKISDVFKIDDMGNKVKHTLYDQFINSNLVYNMDKSSLLRCKNNKCIKQWSNISLVQAGSQVNSLKAIQIEKGAGSTVFGIIKINTLKSSQPFLYWDDGPNLWAVGRCKYE